MRWAAHVARMGDERCIGVLVGKREGKGPLGRPNADGRIILKCLQEVGCGGMEWIKLA
jgi:hypothetical protein